jgi:hypothetical protein
VVGWPALESARGLLEVSAAAALPRVGWLGGEEVRTMGDIGMVVHSRSWSVMLHVCSGLYLICSVVFLHNM